MESEIHDPHEERAIVSIDNVELMADLLGGISGSRAWNKESHRQRRMDGQEN